MLPIDIQTVRHYSVFWSNMNERATQEVDFFTEHISCGYNALARWVFDAEDGEHGFITTGPSTDALVINTVIVRNLTP
jgi:hypothetical protein